MEKTKLGISVTLAASLIFLLCLFGGYIAALLFVGYIFLREESVWLKKNALSALLLLMLFSVFSYLLGLVPDMIYIVDDFVGLFGGSCSAGGLQSFINMLNNILGVLKTVVFLLFALFVGKGKEIKIFKVDKIVERNFE